MTAIPFLFDSELLLRVTKLAFQDGLMRVYLQFGTKPTPEIIEKEWQNSITLEEVNSVIKGLGSITLAELLQSFSDQKENAS